MSTKAAREHRQAKVAEVAQAADRGHRGRLAAAWATVLVVLLGIVGFMLATSQPESSTAIKTAPDFTLTDTTGQEVALSDYRGSNVVLYFNEGAGCQSCLVQMAEIEKEAAALKDLNVTVLPIVMNTREQITDDMQANGVATPFLLDDGTVSQAYGTLGKGMHAGLPGHSFVLIDKAGEQRWYGEYPSMWLSPDQLMTELRARLAT
jgi:peroxiredoxin